jgi:hypothetical protein
LLDSLAECLQAAAELPALLATLDERRLLSDHVHDTLETRTAIEFDLAEASLRNLDEELPYIAQLRILLRSEELDTARRVRAARLLMIAADNSVDEALASEVYLTNIGLIPDDIAARLARHQTSLIFHSIFGERPDARHHIEELEGLARGCKCSWASVTSLLNAQFARRIVDRCPTDYAAIEQCFEACRAARMDSLALRVCSQLATGRLEDGDLDEARRWGATARQLASQLQCARLPGDYITSQVDLALLSGQYEAAETLLRGMPHAAPVTASPRVSKEFLVYQLRVAQMSGQCLPSEQELTALVQWHERARHHGRHDDHMEILWVALNTVQQPERASELLAEYLNFTRRELRPANYLLRMRTAADKAWGSSNASASLR